jgi:hypothetical protein
METMELSPISIIRLFETDKSQRQSFVLQVIDRLENGTADPLETHLQVKCMESLIKDLNENTVYKNYLLEAAAKEGKSFTFHNAKFETKEVGVKYSFDKCGDPEIEQLQKEKKALDEKLKAREAFLKTVPVSGLEVIVGDEVCKVYPPAKVSTTSVCVTLK